MKKLSYEIQDLPKRSDCVRIFTDGSCWPNPGPHGSWAFIIQYQDGNTPFKSSGFVSEPATNNRMELTAVIEALKSLEANALTVELVTDSEYVGKGIAQWMAGWKKAGWRVKNSDLWQELEALTSQHRFYVTCIRGHRGQPENEECDKMAEEIRKANTSIRSEA